MSIICFQAKPTLITKTTGRQSILQSILSRHQSSRAWRCCGVSGSLATGTRDLSPAASRGSQWSLVTHQVQNMLAFLPWMVFGRPSLLAHCVDIDVRLYYLAAQNLVYGCGNIPQTTAESSDTPPILCAQHVQQSVDMSIQFPAGLQSPFKWLKLFNTSTYLSAGHGCTLE